MKKMRWLTLLLCAMLTTATLAFTGCKGCRGDEDDSSGNDSSVVIGDDDPDAEPDFN